MDAERLAAQISQWWRDQTEEEVAAVVPKAVEYGALDLVVVGRTMAGISHMKCPAGVDENQFYTEVGIFFYIVGKMARWEAALGEGRTASDDTLFDIGIYLKMAQRNRAVGGWPYDPDENKETDLS